MALLEREGIKKGSIAAILHVCLGLLVVVSCAHALDLHHLVVRDSQYYLCSVKHFLVC